MIKYDLPEINSSRDIIIFFAEYYEERFGHQIGRGYFGKAAGWIKRMEQEGYDLKDISTLVWGVINTKEKTKSIVYCQYFKDELDKFKKLMNKYKNQKDNQQENDDDYFIDKDREGDNPLDEFL